jgi:signal transduction histidine kinase
MKLDILVVDDDETWTRTFCDNLRTIPPSDLAGAGFDELGIQHATNQEDADLVVSCAGATQFHLILLDLNYPRSPKGLLRLDPRKPLQGMVWLPDLKRLQPKATIVILTGWAYEKDLLHAVEAIRDFHASDFLPKTAPFEAIASRISIAMRNARQKQRLLLLEKEWPLLAGIRAAKVIEEDVSDLRSKQSHRLDRIAQRIESGDPSAIASAPDGIRAEIRAAAKELDEVAEMVDRRLNPGERKKESVDLAELTQDLLLLYDPRLEEAGAKAVAPDPRPKPEIVTYIGDLKAALHEVITNAIESLACSSQPKMDRKLEISITPQGGNAVIQVEDNGDGFSDEAVANLFKLGRTTRNPHEHVGMGLYVARRAMIALGGDIKAENRPEGGAEVRLLLPNLI